MKLVKDKTRLTLKIFVIVWIVLIVSVVLKLTFNYWQPYVIPNEQLQIISDFIDNNVWLKTILNGIFYIINATFMLLSGLQRWWFKDKTHTICVYVLLVIGFISTFLFPFLTDIVTLLLSLGLPLILDYKKWLYIIITFILSNIFLALSLWLEGFVTSNEMNYVINLFLQNDYYIMLALNYILFNFIRERKEIK